MNSETYPYLRNEILGGIDEPKILYSHPWYMPTTGTKPKKHLNKRKLSSKLRKKHRKAARHR